MKKREFYRTMLLSGLQMFADGENNDLAARSYQLEFKKLLQAVFKAQAYFADFFGGGIEALDGVQENETAFYVKTPKNTSLYLVLDLSGRWMKNILSKIRPA